MRFLVTLNTTQVLITYKILRVVSSQWGKAQRAARPACVNSTVHFLLTCRLAMLVPPSEWPLKTNAARITIAVRILTVYPYIPEKSPKDLWCYWTNVYAIFTVPPNGPVLFCSLASVVCRSSSSVVGNIGMP